MSRHLRTFLLAGLPLVVYLSLFSKEISNVLLGQDFREAFEIMPFIFFAAFLQGLSNFYELRMKFSAKMRLLGIVFVIVAVFNLLFNLLVVPEFGYFWAAFSTALSFVLMLMYFSYRDPVLLSSLRRHKPEFLKLTGLLGAQTALFLVVENFDRSMPIMIGLGLIFVFSYGWVLKSLGVFTEKYKPDEN
jgi:O-antigen/teichoic acid export membrane protein